MKDKQINMPEYILHNVDHKKQQHIPTCNTVCFDMDLKRYIFKCK